MVVMATEAYTVNAGTSSVEQLVNEAAFELGIQSLKPKQREAIISYLSATDTLVVLSMGYGKSLIYAALVGKNGFANCHELK